MKQITIFQSEDGTRHETAEAATANDKMIEALDQILRPLSFPFVGDLDFANGQGYWQHDPQTVASVKASLVIFSRPYLAEWYNTQENIHGKDMNTIHGSWFCRMLDGAHRPLERAWSRFMRIDEKTAREYGQPYYASHPDEIKGGCLNPK